MTTNNFSLEFKKQIVQLLEQSEIKIKHCLEQLDEKQIWWRPEAGMNSIGNLVLHVCGNLMQWAVVPLTGSEDHRNRQAEFDAVNVASKDELLDLINTHLRQVKDALDNLHDDRWTEKVEVQGFKVTLLEALMHTSSHFQGHTHQIILITRLIRKDSYQFQWSPQSNQTKLPM